MELALPGSLGRGTGGRAEGPAFLLPPWVDLPSPWDVAAYSESPEKCIITFLTPLDFAA